MDSERAEFLQRATRNVALTWCIMLFAKLCFAAFALVFVSACADPANPDPPSPGGILLPATPEVDAFVLNSFSLTGPWQSASVEKTQSGVFADYCPAAGTRTLAGTFAVTTAGDDQTRVWNSQLRLSDCVLQTDSLDLKGTGSGASTGTLRIRLGIQGVRNTELLELVSRDSGEFTLTVKSRTRPADLPVTRTCRYDLQARFNEPRTLVRYSGHACGHVVDVSTIY